MSEKEIYSDYFDFPIVRSILWDHKAIGQNLEIEPFNLELPSLNINDTTVSIMKSLRNKSKIMKFVLVASLHKESDGTLLIEIERHETEKDFKKITCLNDTMYIPCNTQVANSSVPFSSDDYESTFKFLQDRLKSSEKISLCKFFYPFMNIQLTSNIEIKCDLIYPYIKFTCTPICNVALVPSALAKNLASPYSRSYIMGEPQSGYLSMDQTRKVLLILESDPKTQKLPLIGIWVSGVCSVTDPFVWASCCRFIFSDIKERAMTKSDPFLLILYSTEHSNREYYDVVPADGKFNIDFQQISFSHAFEPNNENLLSMNIHSIQFLQENMLAKKTIFGSSLKKWHDKLNLEAISKNKKDSKMSDREFDEIIPQPAVQRDLNKPNQMHTEVPELTFLNDFTPEHSKFNICKAYSISNNDESIPKPPINYKKSQQYINKIELRCKPASISVTPVDNNIPIVQEPVINNRDIPEAWLEIVKRQDEEIKSLKMQVQELLLNHKKAENICHVSVQSSPKIVESESIGVNTSFIFDKVVEPLKTSKFNTPINQRLFKDDIQITSSPQDLLKSNVTFGDLCMNNDSCETTRSEQIIDMPEFANSINSDRLNDESTHSPMFGESVSMYQQGGLTAKMPHYENKSYGVDNLFEEDYSSFSESDDEIDSKIKNVEPIKSSEIILNTEERGCSPIKSFPVTPNKNSQRSSMSNITIDIATKTQKELEHLGICFDPYSENFSFKPDSDGTLYLDPSFLPKVQYTSLLLSSSECDETDSLLLKYLRDEQLTNLSKIGNSATSSAEPTFFQSNNMSFATKKYLDRYGLNEKKKKSLDKHSQKASTCPNTPARLFVKKKTTEEQQWTDCKLLDIEKLKALPRLI